MRRDTRVGERGCILSQPMRLLVRVVTDAVPRKLGRILLVTRKLTVITTANKISIYDCI